MMGKDIEELKEDIEHDASKIFYARTMVWGGWVAFIVSYFPPAPLDVAIGLPGLLAFIGGTIMSLLYLFVDEWYDAEGMDRTSLHGRLRSERKMLRRLEAERGSASDGL